MKRNFFRSLTGAAFAAATTVLVGCATPDAAPMEDGPVAGLHDKQAQSDLDAGIARYERGQYGEAIRTLQSSAAIWAASGATRVTAFKYLAFSQCVSNRRKACRESFEALLQLDPKFELAANEAGHPQWGPVFRAARAGAVQAQRAK